MATYGVLILRWDAEQVNEMLLTSIPARLAFFRDYHGDSSYKLNILDCLRGLQTGCNANSWFNTLALTKFPHATNPNLDMNWIIPGEVLAFKDPTINREKEVRTISKAFMKELKRCGVRVIVRLNGNDHNTNIEYYGKSYNANDFKKEQFFHYEIPFTDVGTPTTVQAHHFVALCERYGGKMAVHCHAGLGRTATMIGCYLIKNFGFDARSACGWLKVCRRGSVMGPQHFFLDKYQADLENIKNSALALLSTKDASKTTEMEIVCREQQPSSSVPGSTLPMTKTKISRSPRKNNIIHIAPVNIRQRTKKNPMQKYKFDLGVESVDSIRSETLQMQQRHQQPSTRPPSHTDKQKHQQQKIATTEKAPVFNSTMFNSRPPSPNTRGRGGGGGAFVATKHPTTKKSAPRSKRPRTQSRPRLCYSKIPERPSQAKIEPMNRRGLESKKSKSHGTVSSHGNMMQSSSNWSQWSEKVIEGLVSQSKSRIYGLINSVYSRQGLECE